MGYQKYVKIDRNRGHITIIARDGEDSVKIPLHGNNDLWFHTKSHTAPLDNNNKPPLEPETSDGTNMFSSALSMELLYQPCVNRLSDAAQWELWHQPLAHSGTTDMEQLHKDDDGVPKLCGNAFFRCPSFMSVHKTTRAAQESQCLNEKGKYGNRLRFTKFGGS